MIIDVHTHIGCYGEFLPYAWWEVQRSTKFRNIVTRGRNWTQDLSETSPKHTPDPWDISDIDGDVSIPKMDEAGIDKCIMLPLDFQLMGQNKHRFSAGFSNQKRSIAEQNKHMCEVAERHPGRYIPFCTIDPRRGREGLDLVERAVLEWGAKGIKLHPSSGYFPNDKEICYPLYELIMELDIPVLTHCGPEGGFCPAKYGDPFCWDDVLSDFPEMRLCLAHAAGSMGEFLGGSLLGPATSMLFFYDNVYVDLSCSTLIYANDPVRFYRELKELLTKIGGRVMFGTDSPWMTNRGPGWIPQLAMFREPKQEYLDKAEVSFNEEEIDWVLGQNAVQWLKLDESD